MVESSSSLEKSATGKAGQMHQRRAGEGSTKTLDATKVNSRQSKLEKRYKQSKSRTYSDKNIVFILVSVLLVVLCLSILLTGFVTATIMKVRELQQSQKDLDFKWEQLKLKRMQLSESQQDKNQFSSKSIDYNKQLPGTQLFSHVGKDQKSYYLRLNKDYTYAWTQCTGCQPIQGIKINRNYKSEWDSGFQIKGEYNIQANQLHLNKGECSHVVSSKLCDALSDRSFTLEWHKSDKTKIMLTQLGMGDLGGQQIEFVTSSIKQQGS